VIIPWCWLVIYFSDVYFRSLKSIFQCGIVDVCTVPDESRIDTRSGVILQEFKSLVYSPDYQPGAKRKVSLILPALTPCLSVISVLSVITVVADYFSFVSFCGWEGLKTPVVPKSYWVSTEHGKKSHFHENRWQFISLLHNQLVLCDFLHMCFLQLVPWHHTDICLLGNCMHGAWPGHCCFRCTSVLYNYVCLSVAGAIKQKSPSVPQS